MARPRGFVEMRVTNFLKSSLNRTASLQEIYSALPSLNQNSIRSALWRMTRIKEITDNISRGIYKLLLRFQKIKHVKRLRETTRKNPQNPFDTSKMELELTIIGYAPIQEGKSEMEDRGLFKPSRGHTKKIQDVLNPILIEEGITIANEHGLFINEMESNFEVRGSQWMEEFQENYNKIWDVEVNFTNDVAQSYTWLGEAFIAETEFD